MSRLPWFADPSVIHCHRNVDPLTGYARPGTRALASSRNTPIHARVAAQPTVFRFGKTIKCTAGAEQPLTYVSGPPQPTDPTVTEVVVMRATEAEKLRVATLHRNFLSTETLPVIAGKTELGAATALHLSSDGRQLSAVVSWSNEGWQRLHAGEFTGVRPLIEESYKNASGELVGAKLQGIELVVSPGAPVAQKGNPTTMALNQPPSVQSVVDEINRQPGRNPLEKTNALLCSRSAAHAALPYAEQIKRADEYLQSTLSGKVPSGVVLASARPAAQSLPDLVREINGQSGRNHLERVNALLLSRRPAHKALPWAEQIHAASKVSEEVLAGRMPAI
ncbi:MAG: hypothetical protein JW940_00500 [Polyangiaceae bacterium]|nr:hypothetical protein [Polyangiaceae bacterium]